MFWTGPVLAGGKLWIANSRGEVSAVRVEDGQPALFTKLGKGVSLAPVVADGTLYVLDDGGKISARSAESGGPVGIPRRSRP